MTDKNNTQNNLKLQQTVRFFETLLRASADGVVITDPAKNIIFVNDTFCKFFSSNRQDMIETSLFVWLAKLGHNAKTIWKELENQINEHGIAKDVEFASKTGEGMRYFSVNSSLLEKVDIEETGLIISIWRDDTERKLPKEALQEAQYELEGRIKERTAQLTSANIELRSQIEERKKIQEALRESEERYRTIVEYSYDMIWTLDNDGKFLFFNKRSEKISGYKLEEWMGKSFAPLILKEDLPKVIEAFQKTLEGHPQQYEVRFTAKNGTIVTLEGNSAPIYSKGKVVGTVTLGRDITERKRTEEALHASEEQFAKAFHSNPGGLTITDLNEGRMIEINDSFANIFGYSREESIGHTTMELGLWITPEDRVRFTNNLKKDGFIRNAELDLRTKNGNIVTILICVELVNIAGKACMLSTFQDITERKRAEEALRESEERLNQAVRVSQLGIFDHDHRTDTIYWSPEQRHIYGLGHEEPVTLSVFLKHLYPQDSERIAKAVRRAHDPTGDGAFDVEHRIVDCNGSIHWLSTRSRTHFEGEGSSRHPVRTVGAVMDITERKRAEEDRIQLLEREHEARTEAKAAKKLDRMKSMFLASTSHELRTPLNSVIGFSSLLLEGCSGPLNPDQKEQLEIVHSSGKHLLTLINEIIDISKIEAGNINLNVSEFKLRPIVDEAASMLRVSLSEKKLDLKVNVQDIIMISDRTRLLQCIMNLLSNAIKYTENGSVEITAKVINDNVIITVSDTGIGIKSEDIPKVFGPFVRLQTPLTYKTSGTGLGLYMVKKITKDFLGGDVEVKSEFGKGSTFTLRVPVKIEA